jgi:hypothetical protein
MAAMAEKLFTSIADSHFPLLLPHKNPFVVKVNK